MENAFWGRNHFDVQRQVRIRTYPYVSVRIRTYYVRIRTYLHVLIRILIRFALCSASRTACMPTTMAWP
jgi:hypothetical protein